MSLCHTIAQQLVLSANKEELRNVIVSASCLFSIFIFFVIDIVTMSFDEGDWSPMKHVDGDRLEGFRESLPQRAERSEELKHQMEKVKEYMDKLSKAQSEVARLFEEQLIDEAGDRESDHVRGCLTCFRCLMALWSVP